MINKKDKKSILSIVAFTDNADIEYQDLINGLKANILTEWYYEQCRIFKGI